MDSGHPFSKAPSLLSDPDVSTIDDFVRACLRRDELWRYVADLRSRYVSRHRELVLRADGMDEGTRDVHSRAVKILLGSVWRAVREAVAADHRVQAMALGSVTDALSVSFEGMCAADRFALASYLEAARTVAEE